jgi:UDP-sugar transporter A1/2/3
MIDAKTVSLATLLIQATSMAIAIRLCTDQGKYVRSVVIVMDELIKLIVCWTMLFFYYLRIRNKSYSYQPLNSKNDASSPYETGFVWGWLSFCEQELFGSIKVFLSMSVPAICYVVQKNLRFIAMGDLNPAVYQILYQGKILTTALFSSLILKRQFSRRQKVAMGLLFIGCSLVQLSAMGLFDDEGGLNFGVGTSGLGGLAAILGGCMTSGFSGVYLEKAIKGIDIDGGDTPHAIWVRNIQLAMFGLTFACIDAFIESKSEIDKGGLLQGFTPLVWLTVMLSVIGGLAVSMVMKYADNMIKTFTTSLAIVLTSVISIFFFNLRLSFPFMIGASLTLFAVHLYSKKNKDASLVPVDVKAEELEEFGVVQGSENRI